MVIARFIDQALANKPVQVYDDGEQIRCFAHVREVVECVMNLTNCEAAEGRVFNIGSDVPVSIRELAEAVIQNVGSSAEIEYLPYSQAYGDDFEDVRRRVPDVSRLEETLGSTPSVPLDEILKDIIAFKRSQMSAE